jgi:hypothetical protein
MKEASKMYYQVTLWDLINATSSLESAGGHSHSKSPGSQMIIQSGQEAAHANLSARQAIEAGLMTLDTFGRTSDGSSSSEDLQRLLESRLRQQMAGRGFPGYKLTSKHWDMGPLPPIYALRALAPRTSASGYIGLPTPVTSEFRDFSRPDVLAKCDKGGRIARWICARSSNARMKNVVVGLNPSFAGKMMGYPPEWDECGAMVTLSTQS